ncbi:MAG: CDP-alcohol phosphatidyltransferase family protein [Thermoprotei archaeon]|nr:MAG: CDP-alcohol phosphatidyltransferase family protein [Thermoprotei archaeon]
MLTKLRGKVNTIINHIVRFLAPTKISPNAITVASLFVALSSILVAYYKNHILFSTLILFSGFLDVIDGALARYKGEATAFGAFLDSTIDRINDSLFIIGLYILGLNLYIALSLIIVSFLISYTRARAESLGVKMEGIGFIERSERLLFLFIIALTLHYSLYISHIVALILLILSVVTVFQRILFVYNKLHSDKKS